MGKAEEPIGISTVKPDTKAAMEGVLAGKAPRRKQQVLIPKKKRVQRRLRPKETEQSESEGEGVKIHHKDNTLASQPKFKFDDHMFQKTDFKHW